MLVRSREHAQGDLSLPCFPFAKGTWKVTHRNRRAPSARSTPRVTPALGEVNAVAGYLNIKADPHWLANQVMNNGVRIGDAYGKKPAVEQQILIEHTSANPNGPFHVGRARNAILGDTLVRLHRLHGNNVRAEYYVDDMGKASGCVSLGTGKPFRGRS